MAGVTVLATNYATQRQTPIYRSSAEVAVVPSPEIEDPADVMRSLETLERRTIIATFASLAETRESLETAGAGLTADSSEIRRYRVQASVVPRTNIIRVTVTGPDGALVDLLANRLVEVVAVQAKTNYRVFEMRSLERAQPASIPFHPEPSRNAVVASILGLFAGLLVALILEVGRHRVRPDDHLTEDEVETPRPGGEWRPVAKIVGD